MREKFYKSKINKGKNNSIKSEKYWQQAKKILHIDNEFPKKKSKTKKQNKY